MVAAAAAAAKAAAALLNAFLCILCWLKNCN
jgi:hypothetical protein